MHITILCFQQTCFICDSICHQFSCSETLYCEPLVLFQVYFFCASVFFFSGYCFKIPEAHPPRNIQSKPPPVPGFNYNPEPRQANLCPAIQRGQGSGFLSEGSSWLTACISEQRSFWRDCANAQARLNLRCSHRR